MCTLWEKTNWISNPAIEPETIAKALKLEELEKEVIITAGQQELKQLLAKSMEDEIKASSGIEGIQMDSMKIRSSIARDKGWIQNAWSPDRQDSGKETRAVRAAIHMMESGQQLTHDTLRKCHSMLPAKVENGWGKYRDHSESVYDENNVSVYDAPDAPIMREFMDRFMDWWNADRRSLPLAIGSALGHLYFETIHPFHDGNGRIGRMLADKAWVREDTFRTFSVSAAIASDKNRYYEHINNAQTKCAVAEWISYMLKAQESAIRTALERAKKLAAIRNWLAITDFTLDSSDLAIIYEMGLSNRDFSTEFDVTRYMPDGELSEKAWDKLGKLGIIKDGKLVIMDARSSHTGDVEGIAKRESPGD